MFRNGIKKVIYEELWNEIEKVINEIDDLNLMLHRPRKFIFERLEDIVKKSFPNEKEPLRLLPYGSFKTELLTPFSDIDLSIHC